MKLLNAFNLKKRSVMKNLKTLLTVSVLTLSFGVLALFGLGEDKKETAKEKKAEECKIPAFAKAIGHEDMWLLHNGCPPRNTTEGKDKKAEEAK